MNVILRKTWAFGGLVSLDKLNVHVNIKRPVSKFNFKLNSNFLLFVYTLKILEKLKKTKTNEIVQIYSMSFLSMSMSFFSYE